MTTPDRRTFLQVAAAGAAALALPVQAQELGLEAVGGALALKVRDALRSLPAGREGSGVPIWILSSSRCGYCQKMNRERPGPAPGIETNYIAYPLADAESGAVAKAWRQRSIAGYRRFMGGAYAIAAPVTVPRVTGRSAHGLRPDAELSDAQLFDKHYTQIHLIKSLWAKNGRIESVTPESYFFVRTTEGPSVIRLGGDGVPVLREMRKEYPAWFRDLG